VKIMADMALPDDQVTVMVTVSGLVPARFNAEYIIKMCRSSGWIA